MIPAGREGLWRDGAEISVSYCRYLLPTESQLLPIFSQSNDFHATMFAGARHGENDKFDLLAIWRVKIEQAPQAVQGDFHDEFSQFQKSVATGPGVPENLLG